MTTASVKVLPVFLIIASMIAVSTLTAAVSGCNGSNQDQTRTFNDSICTEDLDQTGTEFVTNSDFTGGTANWRAIMKSRW